MLTDGCQAYIPAFSLLRCGIYVGQDHLHYDIQAEIKGTVINKCWPIRRAMVTVIIFLHALITVGFAANWSRTSSAFIDNGKDFWTVNLQLTSVAQATSLEVSIAASVSTILTDIYMVCATLGDLHQLTIVSTLDLVLLDGLGTTLARCSASNTFPNFRNW